MHTGVHTILEPVARLATPGRSPAFRRDIVQPPVPGRLTAVPTPSPARHDRPHAVRRILDVDVAVLRQDEAVALVQQAVRDRRGDVFAFCNAHTANLATGNAALRAALGRATVFNDGIGLDLASELLHGTRFPDNLNGTDLTPAVLSALPVGTPVFLLGSAPGVAEKAGAVLARRHDVAIAGTHHGFFTDADEPALVERIAASGARLVIVAMGNPRQEIWADRQADRLGIPLLCVGAFLDFTAGVVGRAPRAVRRVRLEWAWRLMLEPRRMARRYLFGNATFLAAVVGQRAGLGSGARRNPARPT